MKRFLRRVRDVVSFALIATAPSLGCRSQVARASPEDCENACRHMTAVNPHYPDMGITLEQCQSMCAMYNYSIDDTACINAARTIDQAEMCVTKANARQ